MRTVKVSKVQLLDELKTNLAKHAAEYEEARDNYASVVVEALRDRAQSIEDGGKVDLSFSLPKPVSFASDYETAIAKLEWEVEAEVELDEREFQQYVMNKWQFSEIFAASTSSYVTR